MLRRFNGELRELSLKQREMLLAYEYDKYSRDFPVLPRRRPEPIVIPPRDLTCTPFNSPKLNGKG